MREEVQHHVDARFEVLVIGSPRTLPAWRERAGGARKGRRAREAAATIGGNARFKGGGVNLHLNSWRMPRCPRESCAHRMQQGGFLLT